MPFCGFLIKTQIDKSSLIKTQIDKSSLSDHTDQMATARKRGVLKKTPLGLQEGSVATNKKAGDTDQEATKAVLVVKTAILTNEKPSTGVDFNQEASIQSVNCATIKLVEVAANEKHKRPKLEVTPISKDDNNHTVASSVAPVVTPDKKGKPNRVNNAIERERIKICFIIFTRIAVVINPYSCTRAPVSKDDNNHTVASSVAPIVTPDKKGKPNRVNNAIERERIKVCFIIFTRTAVVINPYSRTRVENNALTATALAMEVQVKIEKEEGSTNESNSNHSKTTKIKALSMMGNKSICARVLTKEELIPFSGKDGKGPGMRFHFVVSDAREVRLRCTFFVYGDKAIYEKIEVGKMYTFHGGQLKRNDIEYKTCSSQFEMTLNERSTFEEVSEIQVDESDGVEADIVYIPLKELTLENRSPSIRAKVYHKTGIASWTKGNQEGCVFSVDLADSSGTTIRGVFFNESALKFEEKLKLDQTYSFIGGILSLSKHGFDQCNSPFEFKFAEHCEIDYVPTEEDEEELIFE